MTAICKFHENIKTIQGKANIIFFGVCLVSQSFHIYVHEINYCFV